MMNDPIADLLTRIRNAVSAKHNTVLVPSSRLKREILDVLKREGYIVDYTEAGEAPKKTLRIVLKYTGNREPILKSCQRVSKPSLRRYAGSQDIKQVRSGLGISIVTTSKGVMTGRQARSQNIGGEVLCEIW